MRIPTTFTTLVACALLLALPASAAWANAADDRIIKDCQESPTGALRGSYPQQQLRHALNNLPGDVREYTGCSEAIRQAVMASVGGGGSGTTGAGGGFGGTGPGAGTATGGPGASAGLPGTAAVPDAPPPPGADRPLDVAGTAVAPGALPEIGRDAHRLPTSLLVLLALLGAAALVPAALTIGRRVVGDRGT